MIKNFYKLALLLPLLSSCASIQKTIPVTSEFKQDSEVILLNTPSLTFFNAVFNKTLGTYSVENTKRTASKTTETFVEDSSITKHFTDEVSFIIDEFEINRIQHFSFELQKQNELIAVSQCDILSQSIDKKTITSKEGELNILSVKGDIKRAKTSLICTISHNDRNWKLTLVAPFQQKFNAMLTSKNRLYKLTNVSALVDSQRKIKKVEDTSYYQHSLNSGLKISNHIQQSSALSFAEKPTIWLKYDLPEQEKQLLLSVNYSLLMFDWLDSGWKE
jgi:hypothetical protein